MFLSESSWYMIYCISIVLVFFCSGVILGAYIISRRNEKLFKSFADVLTKDQKSDIMFKYEDRKDN